MRKLFHFDAPRDKYQCDAAIVWCFDNRFELGFRKFLRRIGVTNLDPIKIAGGAKALASPELESERAFVLEQIRKSIRLHHTRRVILMLHTDCGAYGGLSAFGDNSATECEHHRGELQRAAAYLHSVLPGVDVDCFYVNFEGVWDPEVAA